MNHAIMAIAPIVLELTDVGREALKNEGLAYLSGAEIEKCKRIVEAVREADEAEDYYQRSMEELAHSGQL